MGRPKRSTAKKGREGPRKKSRSKSSPPKKQDDLDQPLQSTEDKIMPDAFAKEESTIPVETVDMSFPDEWQNFLSFPADEKDSMFFPSAMLPTPFTNPTISDIPFQFPTPAPSKVPTPPPPIPIERQDAPLNFEDLSSDGTDICAGPGPPPLPTRNNSLQLNTSHGNIDASLETHRTLSKVLYELRLDYGKEWSIPESECPRRDALFRSVSLLCDIVQEILTGREGLAGRPANIDSETTITFMLTLTGISMILNIYKSLCQMYNGYPDIMETGRNASDADRLFEPLAIPPSNASASLDKIVHLTTMDFHLARLQRMFSTPNAPSNFQMALLGTGEGGEQIHELRTTVQRLIERLKTA
ncbi:MAG: hypothetical protein ASARMPREDX12_000870 [Alectoria sarmentosa]|nr:MAG: hypothetical protein ASARMPREDX12_000870 [Alectoria sarmentosa]